MVKVIDKRPTNPQDSLRRLLDGIKTPASVPHGIKVAGPNDYVSFMDSAGVSHRWDGDAIATYNARLAEAESAMEEASAELDEAKAELEAAKERIGAASGDLTAYIEKVEAAQAKADAVQASFEGVAGELDTVAAAVEAVKARTTTVEGETGRLSGAVENALAEASEASSRASEAGDKAEAAAADAARVQALAQNASTAAEEAEHKALEAAGIAAGKGKVIYGGTAPVGADAAAGNLWIRSTDNRPHRWSGSAWVAVTDKVATDAAASAAAASTLAAQAKSAADKAQADATSAATAAQDAMRAAGQAQDSANGKNTVSYTTGTPAGVGTRLGDTHYQVNAAGTVLRWWRWSGTAWVEQALDGQVISSLDAGKITAGTLDAARIRAGSITGDKINAQSVAAAVGTFVKVNAENVGVSGELAARVVSAMSAQVKNLVVTESAILQHTTLLGTTVAEQLNVTKKLVARNAIVDGTLDVAQLNVTEQMAASIVNAMSVNAKKLVVTEDAIMNQLTVIQNIVTPELIAERINVKNLGAALVTAGALQTDDAANRGVKITSTGINAWDTVGRQTIRLDGTNNLISGALETGSTTEGRMRAFNFTNPVNSRPQGVITLSSTPQGQGKQGVMKFDTDLLTLEVKPNGTQDHTGKFEKGLMIGEDSVLIRGDLSLDGAFRQSQAMQRGGMTGTNIPPGEVRAWNVTYPTRFDSRVGIRVLLSPSTDTGAAIAYGISNSTYSGFTLRVKNTDSIGTGNLWFQWFAIGII